MAKVWPKSYILQIYAKTVEAGMIWITPISPEDAKSLRARAYRARRHADTSMATFIAPEYHLVTFSNWEPGPDLQGRMAAIYNKLPDGEDLPGLEAAESTDISGYVPQSHMLQRHSPAPQPAPTEADLLSKASGEKLSDEEVGSFVERMKRKVRESGDE